MTKRPEFNFPLFDEVEAALRRQGHDVISPAEHDRQVLMEKRGLRPEDVPGYYEGDAAKYAESIGLIHDLLAWDFHVIMDEATGIVMLPDWEHSTGARAERLVAEAVARTVYFADAFYDNHAGAPDWVIYRDGLQRRCHDELANISLKRHLSDAIEADETSTLDAEVCTFSDGVDVTDDVFGCLPPIEPLSYEERAAALARFSAPRGEVRVIDPVTGAAKGRKPQAMDLLPYDVLLDVSEHYNQGAEKYEPRNWEKGYAWSSSFAALMRHLAAWWQGENNDPDFGHSHLRGVIFHALTLRAYEMRGAGTDDRPKVA